MYLQDVVQRYPETQLAYGRAVTSVYEWALSLQEAEMTAQLLRVVPRPVLGYHEIGIYQLLLPMLKSPETLHFHRQQLQPLLEYENSADGELLHTLAAYFECNGNLARTAESIHVHRNTLLYPTDSYRTNLPRRFRRRRNTSIALGGTQITSTH
jgi:purine catabolism regulator